MRFLKIFFSYFLAGAFFIISPSAFSANPKFLVNINTSLPNIETVVDSSTSEKCGKLDIPPADKTFSVPLWSLFPGNCTVHFSILLDKNRIASYKIENFILQNTFISPAYFQSVQQYPSDKTDNVSSIISIANRDPSRWMTNSADKLAGRTINEIFLPGTHDSGTSTIQPSSSTSTDSSTALWVAANVLDGSKWGRTQRFAVAEQLNHGIRYLDLRICGKGTSVNDMYACHGLQGESFKKIISDVKKFLSQSGHEYEMIILDFNHWYNSSDAGLTGMRASAMNYMMQELSPWVAPRKQMNSNKEGYTPHSTMQSFWEERKQVIIAFDKPLSESDPNSFIIWHSVNTANFAECNTPLTDICSYWPNKQDATSLQNSIKNTINNHLKNNSRNYIFVLQAQLTPNTKTILFNSNSSSHFTGDYKQDMTMFLNTPNLFDGVSGLVIIEDFSTGIDLTDLVMRLNAR